MRARVLLVVLLLGGGAVGCASGPVVLAPGPIALSPQKTELGSGWSIAVSEARDVRAPERAGQQVGNFYTRFEKAARPALLEKKPELYVREQLSRFLFSRGWEASGAGNAKAFVSVDLEDFSMTEKPGSVWDEVVVNVAYTARLVDRSNKDLGSVRLESHSEVKSPFDTKAQVEKALRTALADTFESLAKSQAFQAAMDASRR